VIKSYWRDSIRLTQANSGAVYGATLLVFAGSALTLFLAFPVLLTGLEGIYIRAKLGKPVRAATVLTHANRFFTLLLASAAITLSISLSLIGYAVFCGLFFLLLHQLNLKPAPQYELLGIVISIAVYLLLLVYLEGRYIHTRNFIAELRTGVREGMRRSKKAITSRSRAAFLAFLYLLAIGASFPPLAEFAAKPSLGKLAVLLCGFLFLPVVAGMAALSFLNDAGSEAVLAELEHRSVQTGKKELSGEVEPDTGFVRTRCPACGRLDVVYRYLEDGTLGDWCSHCKKSLKSMQGAGSGV
jgi:hypothetical protein